MTRKPLIAGNWKMNGSTAGTTALAGEIAEGVGGLTCEVLICPPTPLIPAAAAALGGGAVSLGGQDCHAAQSGAHTGDVSAAMLVDVGCAFVIVGHSERRQDHGETSTAVGAKAAAAHAAGLTAIVCVGETEAERDAGKTMDIISDQLNGSVPDGARPENTVIAYEPVWAIGTGRTPSPEDANEVHRHIRSRLEGAFGADAAAAFRILYGGSMKPGNAADLLTQPDIDGGLIGGASLKAADFLAIARAAG